MPFNDDFIGFIDEIISRTKTKKQHNKPADGASDIQDASEHRILLTVSQNSELVTENDSCDYVH